MIDTTTPIYIAGHRGLVGSALMRALTARGYTNLITRTRSELDLTNQAAVNEFFATEKPGLVFLAAAKVGGIMANNTYRADFIYDNLAIATNVIRAAYEHGTAKLINLGSSCIYPKLAPQPMKEEHLLTGPLEPTNEPYAIAKIAALKLCRYFHEQYGCNFISAMPTNLYGPGDNFDLQTSHALVADLFVNVGTGSEISIREFATLVAEVEGYEGEIHWDTTKPNGTPRKLMDGSLMQKLGWEPKIGLKEGIGATYEWFREHGSHRERQERVHDEQGSQVLER